MKWDVPRYPDIPTHPSREKLPSHLQIDDSGPLLFEPQCGYLRVERLCPGRETDPGYLDQPLLLSATQSHNTAHSSAWLHTTEPSLGNESHRAPAWELLLGKQAVVPCQKGSVSYAPGKKSIQPVSSQVD